MKRHEVLVPLLRELEQLAAAFLSLSNVIGLELPLNNLAEALDKHIRKEGRQLFPLIEEHCPAKLLGEIKIFLTKNLQHEKRYCG